MDFQQRIMVQFWATLAVALCATLVALLASVYSYERMVNPTRCRAGAVVCSQVED